MGKWCAMTDAARIGEAISALSHRLESWGCDDPQANAQEFVEALVRQGWRPRALATVHPIGTGRISPPTDEYAAARQAARAQPRCSHGVKPDRCLLAHDSPEDVAAYHDAVQAARDELAETTEEA